MKKFLNDHWYLIKAILFICISLVPTIFTLFFEGRAFVDLGLLFTGVIFVILVIPIFNAFSTYSQLRFEKSKETK